MLPSNRMAVLGEVSRYSRERGRPERLEVGTAPRDLKRYPEDRLREARPRLFDRSKTCSFCPPRSLQCRRLLNDTLQVDVVLRALVFHEASLRGSRQPRRVGRERTGQHIRIVDHNPINEGISLERVTLHNVILGAGHLHISRTPDLAVEIGDVNDQRIALPVTYRIAIIGRRGLSADEFAVRGNDTKRAKCFVQDHDLVGSLNNLEWKRHADNSRNARHEAMHRGIVDILHLRRFISGPLLHRRLRRKCTGRRRGTATTTRRCSTSRTSTGCRSGTTSGCTSSTTTACL